MKRPDGADLGWALVAGVVALDVWLLRTGRVSMSRRFDEWGWRASLVWAVLTLHLEKRPRRLARLDPISLIARRLEA